jgi:hypothetical protein
MKSTARILIALTLVCAVTSPSLAGPTTGRGATKMAACKKEAKVQKLSGKERKAFIKSCTTKPS